LGSGSGSIEQRFGFGFGFGSGFGTNKKPQGLALGHLLVWRTSNRTNKNPVRDWAAGWMGLASPAPSL